MDYVGNINLLALPYSEVYDRELDDGSIQRGVFIPFDENCIKLSNKGKTVNLWFNLIERRPNPMMASHSIKPYVSSRNREHYIDVNGEIPYIGQCKIRKTLRRFLGERKDLDDILKK